jgi:hypothetical protein
MRPLVRSAMRASAATERKKQKAASSNANPASSTKPPKKTKTQQQPPSHPPSSITRRDDDDDDRPKEFATTSSAVPRRLNDVVMAPPQLKSLPRGAAKRALARGGKVDVRAGTGVLSMAQRAMMEVERENAIRRYREMKERKLNEGDRTLSQSEGVMSTGDDL